jgi:tetratricopeptide (TPR) repeat protein
MMGRLSLVITAILTIHNSLAGIAPVTSATKAFEEARAKFYRQPRNAEADWKFARACFDLAEFATNTTERAELAEQGIAACKELLSREPGNAPGHYYLGMNLGQLARTKGIGALKVVKEMEREFNTAREADEKFDYAGPDRNLGLLYREAPPHISVGSRIKAKAHLERAVELAPDYPGNRLDLCESFDEWSDRNGMRRQLKALDELWPRAKSQLQGNAWEASWIEWEIRREKVRKKLAQPSNAIESPRRKED